MYTFDPATIACSARHLPLFTGTAATIIPCYALTARRLFDELTLLHDPDQPLVITNYHHQWLEWEKSEMLKTPAYQKVFLGNSEGIRLRHVIILSDLGGLPVTPLPPPVYVGISSFPQLSHQ